MEQKHFESLYPPRAWFDEVEKVLSYIKTGNSVQIISIPGVGRSNIMGLLAYNHAARELHLKDNEKFTHFVMMNFSEIKNKSLSETTKYIFLELIDSLEERKMTEAHKYCHGIFKGINSNDELIAFQGLRKAMDYLTLEKKLTVVFLFDRFEDYLRVLEPQFFSNLRVLRDRAKYRFSAIFPLSRPLEELVGSEMIADFYEFLVGNIVYLPIKNDEILNFRLEYIQKQQNEKLTEKQKEEIVALTGGIGKLSRICAEICLQSDLSENIESSLLESKKVQSVLEEIWKSLTPFEQTLIREDRASESSYLVAVGLVRESRLSVPLLQSFAKNQMGTEIIEYNAVSNQIIKGQLIISDSLTSSEYKLLKFFVENPEKILTRDEIVLAVWGDLSSTAGVTEQALDQLIFRVRRKIEENPNSPSHLQTVKGRGYKFTP